MTLVWTIAIVLSLLAVIDLIVGVSNDAVNFLNSAIGSRVATRRAIFWIAGAGVLLGTFFSAGMMEVARKGVIYPQSFFLTELMIIFLAVMIVDILLIDTYNTLGFPTSTTIAVVFELTGAALAIAFIKTSGPLSGESVLSDYINTGRVFLLFSGILVSILFAFLAGALVQFISRLVFSFRYQGRFRLLLSIFGALSVSGILFLIFMKGIDASSLLDNPMVHWTGEHPFYTFLMIFVGTFFLLYLLALLFQVDIPKMVVLFGTFALALSFAANDLVNFIGVPLAGIESFRAFLTSGGGMSPDSFGLSFLTDAWLRDHGLGDWVYGAFFLGSGIVMILTLFYSRKARSVTETEVYLGRQHSGQEHFEPSQLSRILVRQFLRFYGRADGLLPTNLRRFISAKYQKSDDEAEGKKVDGVIYFDTLRASVNLVVASILISLGTWWGFPLSTTFVVFMVAMGTSLADQAWGRESAVYRISGVLSILGGWFITACLGFLGAFILTLLLWWGTQEEKEKFKKEFSNEIAQNIGWMRNAGSETIRKMLLESSKIYLLLVQGLLEEDAVKLLEVKEKTEGLRGRVKGAKTEFFRAMSNMPEESQDPGQFFIQALDYLTELSNTLMAMVNPVCDHVKNQHKGLVEYQREDLTGILEETTSFFNFGKTRINIIYMELLGETRNLVTYSVNLVKSLKSFFE
jgi:phosphate/sulfate permease